MGISASTMNCPVCEGLVLETLATPFGTWERCSNCRGLFIHQDLVTAASEDRAKCKEALEETRALLLPTDRTCPKCLQPLYDGRIETRGVILSLCPTCSSLWTNLKNLGQFEAAIEKKFAAEAESLGVGDAVDKKKKSSLRFYEDSGFGRFFRAFARMFDRMADTFRTDPLEKELLAEVKAAKKKQKKEATSGNPQKLVKSVEPAPPAALPAVLPPKVTPASTPAPVEPPKPAEPVAQASPPEPAIEAPKIEIPEFIFPEEPKPAPAPEPERQRVPPPEVKVEPKPEPVPESKPAPAPTPVPKPAPAPAPVAKPAEKKPILGGPAPKPGFFAQLKAAWSPAPKKSTPKPASAAKPVEPPMPKSVEPPKPKPVKPAPAPKPVKVRPPREPFDHPAFWPPWIVGIVAMLASGLRDYGFEGEAALLWGLMGWSIGMMLRFVRLYPMGDFQNFTLQALADRKAPSARGVPVMLKGQIVPARDEDLKGPVVFKQDERTVALNRIGGRDILPRLFGLANPGQLIKGDVTIKGWYRPGLTPFIEVQEVRTEKTFRKSMTRSLRWVFAVLVFGAALVLYLSLD